MVRALLRMLGLREPGGRARRGRPVSVELNRSFAIAITSVGVVAGIATAMLGVTTLRMNDIIDELGPLATANREIFELLNRAQSGLSEHLTDGTSTGLATFERARQSYPEAVEQARQRASDDPELQGMIERQVSLAERWFDDYAVPAAEMSEQDPEGARELMVEGDQVLDRFEEANLAAGDAIDDERTAAHIQIRATTFTALSVVVVVGLLGMAIALAAAVRARRRITRTLEHLADTLDELRGGDLSARSYLEGPTEVARAAAAVNSMAEEISHLQQLQAHRMQEERSLRVLSREILSHLRTGDVLNVAAEQITRALGVDRTVIRAVGPMGSGILAQWHRPGSYPAPDLPVPTEIFELVRHELETFDQYAVDDVRTDARIHGPMVGYYERLGSRALLVRGVLVGEQAYCIITAHSVDEPRRWSDFDHSVLELAARELGLAIEHATLYEQEASMVVELQQLDQAKEDFVSSISHELRTPLASVLGYTELLRDGDAGAVTAEQDSMLSVIERNTERLHDLIEDLLTLSVLNSDTDDLQLMLSPTDVGALVSDAIEALRPTIVEHGLELRTSVDPELPLLQADRTQLERVLLNVLSNAIKFSLPGGTIDVAAHVDGGDVVVEVADTGIGISEDEQDQLFTRFFRGSEARGRGIQGTGLGLVIVRSIVEQHGGAVSLTSVPSDGTTITMRLPVPPV